MAARSTVLVAAVCTALFGAPALVGSAAVEPPLDGAARATEGASRRANPVLEYEVFGDSIVAGLGVPPHLTWVAGIAFHLADTERGFAEHRFRSHAVDGQAIITRSPLAADPSRPSLVAGIRAFLSAPPGPTPVADRWFVLTPSVNELVLSDQGPSSAQRVARAVDGTRFAIGLLRDAGVPAAQIIVLPMPPVGLQFAAAHDADSEADAPLASMIAAFNRDLGVSLTLPRYPRLDPEDDGLADVSVFDDWRGPSGAGSPDGLHLDAQGHALIAAEIEPLFGTR